MESRLDPCQDRKRLRPSFCLLRKPSQCMLNLPLADILMCSPPHSTKESLHLGANSALASPPSTPWLLHFLCAARCRWCHGSGGAQDLSVSRVCQGTGHLYKKVFRSSRGSIRCRDGFCGVLATRDESSAWHRLGDSFRVQLLSRTLHCKQLPVARERCGCRFPRSRISCGALQRHRPVLRGMLLGMIPQNLAHNLCCSCRPVDGTGNLWGLLIFSAPMIIFLTPILPEVIFLTPGVGPANHLIFLAPKYFFFGPLGTFF